MTEQSGVFAGRVVLVTGAGRGAGRAIALGLAALGARVAANDISPVNVEPLVAEIVASGGQARAYVHDVAKKLDVQALVNNVSDDFGRIDLLVNNANVNLPATLLAIDEWDLHRVFEVNLVGAMLMMQSVGRVMRAQGGGLIANLVRTAPDSPATFIASRAGLGAMNARLNAELQDYGIRVFALASDDPLHELAAVCGQAWADAQP